LVDVRERAEVAELAYGVNNIINIPLSEFEERYMELPKDTELVMVCRDGSKSLRAAGFLVNRGYNVVNMKHGIIRWVQKGFPTIGNTSAVADLNDNSSCCSTSDKKGNSSCCN
jgi:rhodanese-related sulfurtransferase